MPETPLFNPHDVPEKLPNLGNAGLWWNKFFHFYEYNFTEVTPADARNEIPDGKVRWIETVEGECRQKQIIERFARRQYNLGTAQNAQQKFFKTNWHFATGLGYSHPVENGFCWHHTLGVPYLPASSIKGLLRAWIEQWEEFADEGLRKKVLLSWFGNAPKEENHDDLRAGNLIFFDAVPVQPAVLAADVMTPHMGKWYADGDDVKSADGSAKGDASRIPGDWHSPVPVPFLAVKDASFLFQIAARPKSTFEDGYDLDKAMELLEMALEHLGIGAKTAAGYGRLIEDTEILERWEKRREQDAKKRAKQAEREAKQKAAAAITETEETVIMITKPLGETAQVRTERGEIFTCIKIPAILRGETSLSHWQGDDDDKKIEAEVTRLDGEVTEIKFKRWYW